MNEEEPRLGELLCDRRRYKQETATLRKTWTSAEDELLTRAVQAFPQGVPVNWITVAEQVPERTHASCHQRWTKVLRPGLKKGSWDENEDAILLAFVETYAESLDEVDWSALSRQIPGRTSKQCRERWKNVLDPAVRRGRWTAEEDDVLLDMFGKFGPSWSIIAKHMNYTRNENMVKNRWKRLGQMARGVEAQKAFAAQMRTLDACAMPVETAKEESSPTEKLLHKTASSSSNVSLKRSASTLNLAPAPTPVKQQQLQFGGTMPRVPSVVHTPRASTLEEVPRFVHLGPSPPNSPMRMAQQQPPIMRLYSPGLDLDDPVFQTSPAPSLVFSFQPPRMRLSSLDEPPPPPNVSLENDTPRMRRAHSLDEPPPTTAQSGLTFTEFAELVALQESLAAAAAAAAATSTPIASRHVLPSPVAETTITPPPILKRGDSFYEENFQLFQAAADAAMAANNTM